MSWGVVLALSTELLSLVHLLTPVGVGFAWLTACTVAGAVAFRGRARLQPSLRCGASRISPADLAFLGPLGLIILVLGASVVGSAPNTWDSMTYHLARVSHWQQDASLAPYPTHILRQLYLQPGAEFVLLHLQLLSGGDRLAGLAQWASMAGALVGTSLIAGALGAGRFGVMCT